MEQKITTSSSFKVLSAIHDVESRLKKPISKVAFGKLFHMLEDVQKDCSNQELEEKIVSLYGRIVDKYVDTEVQKIVVLADKTKRNFESLRKKIADVKLYGVSRENFSLLNRVEQKIEGSNAPSYTKYPEDPAQLELIEELFSLATLIYSGEKNDLEALYQELPEEAQSLLSKHLLKLKTSLFENDLFTIQALLATAHDLANYPLARYPTREEIELFFSEEKKVKKADPSQYWNYRAD